MGSKTIRLGLENLDSRCLPAAGVNLTMQPFTYSDSTTDSQPIRFTVGVTNPHKTEISYDVQFYWSSTPSLTGTHILAGDATQSTSTQDNIHGHVNKLTARPGWAKYLIAIVKPSGNVQETDTHDNGEYLNLTTGEVKPLRT